MAIFSLDKADETVNAFDSVIDTEDAVESVTVETRNITRVSMNNDVKVSPTFALELAKAKAEARTEAASSAASVAAEKQQTLSDAEAAVRAAKVRLSRLDPNSRFERATYQSRKQRLAGLRSRVADAKAALRVAKAEAHKAWANAQVVDSVGQRARQLFAKLIGNASGVAALTALTAVSAMVAGDMDGLMTAMAAAPVAATGSLNSNQNEVSNMDTEFKTRFSTEKLVRTMFDQAKARNFASKLSRKLNELRHQTKGWQELTSRVSGWDLGMDRTDTEELALRNAAEFFVENHGGSVDVAAAMFIRFHKLASAHPMATPTSLWDEVVSVGAAVAAQPESLAEWLNNLSAPQAKEVAKLGRWSSRVRRKLRAYGMGIHQELHIGTSDLVKQALWPMSRTEIGVFEPQFGDEVEADRVVDATEGEFTRHRLPGVARVKWDGRRKKVLRDDKGHQVDIQYAWAPKHVTLPSGKRGVLVADSLDVSYYATADMPEWLRDAISGAVTSTTPKTKSDLMTLLKRPGSKVDVSMLDDHAELFGAREVNGTDVNDLGVWVLPAEAYNALATQAQANGLGGLQGTVVFDGAYFKGTFVSEEIAHRPVGIYDGVKALGQEIPADLTPQWGSLMTSYVDVPWGCTVNAQAFTYAEIKDGVEAGLTSPLLSIQDEQAQAFTLANANIGGFSDGFANWARAQAAEFGRKRLADGLGGQFVPTNRPDLVGRDGVADVHFVVYTSEKSRDENERNAGFFWSPALPTHTQIPRVNVRFEYHEDVRGNLLAVNTADDEFMADMFISHAGRDLDGDGGALVFEEEVVQQCTPVSDVEMTDSVRWKATEDEKELDTAQDAIRASLTRQFFSEELGTWELKARRALHLGIDLDRVWQGTTLRERFAGQIQMSISAQKKRIRRELWNRNARAIEHALGGDEDGSDWNRLTEVAGSKPDGSEFFDELPSTMVDLPKASEKALKAFRSAENRLRRQLQMTAMAKDSDAYLAASEDDINQSIQDLADWSREVKALLSQIKSEDNRVFSAQALLLNMAADTQGVNLPNVIKDALKRANPARWLFSQYQGSDEMGQREALADAGFELLHDYDTETRVYVAERLNEIKAIWRGESVVDADWQERKELCRTLFDDLVSVVGSFEDDDKVGIGVVAAVAFAGNDKGVSAKDWAPGRLTDTLIGVLFDVQHLVQVEDLTGIELISEFLLPVRGAASVPSVGDKLSYGQLMAQLPEGGLGSLLNKGDEYEVLEVRDVRAKGVTANGVQTAINAVLRLRR